MSVTCRGIPFCKGSRVAVPSCTIHRAVMQQEIGGAGWRPGRGKLLSAMRRSP